MNARTRRVVVSASGERRTACAREWLGECGGAALVIAPTLGAADDLVRGLARERGLLGVHRTTLRLLASEIATLPLAEQGLTPVSELGMEALAARAVHAVIAGPGFRYFGPVARTPGFARALSRTLTELRKQGVAAERLPVIGDAGVDLEQLLLAYSREIDERKLVDAAALYALATAVARSGKHPRAGLPLVLLDVALETRGEIDLVAALAAASDSVLATCPFGDDPSRAGAARALAVTAEDLDANGGSGTRKLDLLRRHVFSPEVAPSATAADDTSVGFSWAPGEGREAIEIARRILNYARAGLRFDHMAVLLRHVESYQPLLMEAFQRAGIPVYFTHGTVRPDPAGRAFLALLACAGEGLIATRFAEYLSLGQVPNPGRDGQPVVREVPWVEPKGAQLVFKTFEVVANDVDDGVSEESTPVSAGTLSTPAQWERLLVDAAVVGGRDRWRRRLGGLRAELELQLQDGVGDENARARIDGQLQRLGHLERFAMPIIDDLAALPETAMWSVWIDKLERLATLVLRRPSSVLAVLGELRPMAEVGPVGLDEVRDVLGERLSLLRDEPPRRRYGHVFVGTIAEARGRSFPIVFLPGLAEGIFPRKASEDPLLLDAARRAIDDLLLTREQRVARERLLLRIAAGAATRTLDLSYPRIDVARGRSRVPSFYALDVLRAAEGVLPNLRELEKRAAADCASPLGWPAPREPRDAIDDSEWDLAVLEPLLRAGAVDVTGRGRYLVQVNACLDRSLRSRWHRWRKSWSEFDGIVDPDRRVLAHLAEEFPSVRSYSPTALQNFASCPYRFLLQAVHRLRPRQQAVAIEQLDPLTRGSIFHLIQAAVLRQFDAAGLLPLDASRLAAALPLADRELDRIAAEQKDKLAPAITRVWDSEIEGLRADLRGWLRKVVDSGTRFRPAWFELSFGLAGEPGRDPRSVDHEIVIAGGARLRGSIDLVEIDDKLGVLRVTDHKTGKPILKPRVVVNGGETLQPVLYALVAEAMLGKPAETGMLFYCTQRGEYRTLEVDIDDHARAQAKRVFAIIAESLREGFLPARPKERACDWCDYKLVCGPYEELRTKDKGGRDPRVRGLDELRKME